MSEAEAIPSTPQEPASAETASPQSAGPGPANRMLAHVAAAMLFGLALFFTAWSLHMVRDQFYIFASLLEPWRVAGGALDPAGMAWSIAAIAFMTVLGWLYLEGLEHYLPPTARLALAFLFGMGLAGFVLECLATFHLLTRPAMVAGLGILLAVLVARVWRRERRPSSSGLGGEPVPEDAHKRRHLAVQAESAMLIRPRSPLVQAGHGVLWTLLGLITLFIFWHAVLYPEVYWDSLILYLGYARMTYLEGGFPLKVTGQVGIGLGANYPHLYSVLGSGVATAAGEWSELPQRLMAPLAGLAATVLVFHAVRDATRHVGFALIAALLFRAVPLGIAWNQYASDYALAVLFGAAFLYLAGRYVATALPGYLAATTLLIGLSMHLNYLMGILWAPWAVMLLSTHLRPHAMAHPLPEAPWTALDPRPGLGALLASRRFWLIVIGAGAIGSTWYIRNWIVTGNPVYAFFHEMLGGRNINPEVMAAASAEWRANGAGIARIDEVEPNRLRALWIYLAMWRQAYRLAPVMLGFTLGGMVVWLARVLAGLRRGGTADTLVRRGWVAMTLFCALWAFHLLMAPYYLYQIIVIVPCMALIFAQGWPWWRLRPWGWALGWLAVLVGLVPGLSMALMGFKVPGVVELAGGRRVGPHSLYVTRNPLPEPERMYRWRYGEDPRMWSFVSDKLTGRRLLTHENRHLVFDPSIELVHLDDMPMQALWGVADPAERVRRLVEEHDIHYYLFVPNERACFTNERMGTAQWPGLGLAELVHEAGENRLYRLLAPRPESQPEEGEAP